MTMQGMEGWTRQLHHLDSFVSSAMRSWAERSAAKHRKHAVSARTRSVSRVL